MSKEEILVSYENYINVIKAVLKYGDLSNFKSHPDYICTVENVSQDVGMRYWNLLSNFYSNEVIARYCKLNDTYGGASKRVINGCAISPTSLRYLFQAHLIWNHIKYLNGEINIVELGGGYGGMCLAMNYLAPYFNSKIETYTIIDISEALQLQKLYLDKHNLSFPVTYLNCNDFGKDVKDNSFLIANYSFSELPYNIREKYIATLFPHISHGFMAWNFIQVYDFGKKLISNVEEYPLTCSGNRYLYF